MTGSCVALRISPTRKTNSFPTRISGSSSPARADTSSTLSAVSVSSTRYKSAPISGLYCASRRRQVRASGLQEAAKTGGEIQAYCAQQVDTLWDEVKRFDNPHTYYVDLSQKLWDIKDRLLHEGGKIS